MSDFFAWEMAYVIGAVVLAGVLAWGLIQYYTRDRRKDPITEEATRMEYDAPIAYQHGGREALKEKADRL